MKAAWMFLKKAFPLLVIVVAFLWSMIAIATNRRQQSPPGTRIELRLGHWQLEAGVREGFNRMAAEYSKLHPEVHIVQDAIPEGTYGQWSTTQLMGGTAPDIIEVGLGVPYNVLLGFHSRYFVPLTAYVKQPNPYNKGTDLEGGYLAQHLQGCDAQQLCGGTAGVHDDSSFTVRNPHLLQQDPVEAVDRIG